MGDETIRKAEELFAEFDSDQDNFWNFKETAEVQFVTEGTMMTDEAFTSLVITTSPDGGRNLTEEDLVRGLSREQVVDLYTNADRQRQLGFVLDVSRDHDKVFNMDTDDHLDSSHRDVVELE